MSQDGAAALSALTASGVGALLLPAGLASLETMTASGESQQGAFGQASLQPLTATGTSTTANDAQGACVLEAMTGAGGTPTVTACTLQPMTATGVNLNGTIATGAAVLRQMQAAGVSGQPNDATGRPSLQYFSALGVSQQTGVGTAAVSLQALRAQGTALTGGVGVGSARLQPMSASVIAVQNSVGQAAINLLPMQAYGFGEPLLPSTFTTFAMNTRNTGVTQYLNYAFNSFAVGPDGTYYGAGPSGLYELTGTDDDGTNIDWRVRTAQSDQKDLYLKRLVEVVAGLRADQPIRVRVWLDDNSYYDYTMNAANVASLYQNRIKGGKGMRSRYYKVELTGMNNGTIALDSLQINMVSTTRRLG